MSTCMGVWSRSRRDVPLQHSRYPNKPLSAGADSGPERVKITVPDPVPRCAMALGTALPLAWPRSNVFIDEDFKNSDKEIQLGTLRSARAQLRLLHL